MKTVFFLLLVSMIYMTGCMSTHKMLNKQASFVELNKELEGEVGRIVLSDGSIIFSENIKIHEDSSYWVEVESLELKSTPTWNVKEVTYDNNSKGAFELAGLGALTGTMIGVAIGYQMTKGTSLLGSPGEPIGIAYGAVIGFTSGIVIGSVIGGVIGHKERYVLSQP